MSDPAKALAMFLSFSQHHLVLAVSTVSCETLTPRLLAFLNCRLANKQLTYSKTQGGKAILTLPLTRNTKARSCKLHFPNELEVVFERVTFYGEPA